MQCACALRLPIGAADAWQVLGDPAVSGKVEWFHRDIQVLGPLVAGTEIRILHGLWGVPVGRFHRVGRLTVHRPPREYAFSDLSADRPRTGFPHVYRLRVLPRLDGSVVRLEVTGRWMARFVPRPIVWLYLWCVMARCRLGLAWLLLGAALRCSLATRRRCGRGPVHCPAR
ncbi:MAG: hypothetical protein AAF823_05280 [Planctomycetota bacterium]